jgi:hypothetical protein
MSIAEVYRDPDAATIDALIRRIRRRHNARTERRAWAITTAAMRRWSGRPAPHNPGRLS